MRKTFLVAFGISCLVFSLQAYEPEIDLNPPSYVEEMPEKDFTQEFSKPGSLFGQGDRPLYANRRAMRPNDLITILIDEQNSSNLTINNNYTGNSGGNITPPQIAYNGADAQQAANTQYLNDQVNYTLTKPNNTTNFQGGGTNSRSQQITLTLSARVLKVMENGNYFIYGKKEMLIDGEKQILQISGVVRPYDIAKENTIQSKYISDAKISMVSVGKISDTTRKKPTTDAVESGWPY